MSGRAFVTTMAVIVDGMEYTARERAVEVTARSRALSSP